MGIKSRGSKIKKGKNQTKKSFYITMKLKTRVHLNY